MKSTIVKSLEGFDGNYYKLSFEKNDIQFKSGQYIDLKLENMDHYRSFSLYSGEDDNEFSIFFKKIKNGFLTPELVKLKMGGTLFYKPVTGSFLSNIGSANNNIFISTGTGIAPFHSKIKSDLNLNYKVIHGVKKIREFIDVFDYTIDNVIICTTEDASGNYHCRITDYCSEQIFPPDSYFYLCGNSTMIIEMINILKHMGIQSQHISYEIFY
jgi:ferredoxin/flavodoxin---NADP+ reductase